MKLDEISIILFIIIIIKQWQNNDFLTSHYAKRTQCNPGQGAHPLQPNQKHPFGQFQKENGFENQHDPTQTVDSALPIWPLPTYLFIIIIYQGWKIYFSKVKLLQQIHMFIAAADM